MSLNRKANARCLYFKCIACGLQWNHLMDEFSIFAYFNFLHTKIYYNAPR